jgi:glycosyltransferase involved in cell wall biosynthesis
VEERQKALRGALNGFALRLAPSIFLAESAMAQGIDTVQCLRHGATSTGIAREPKNLLFLGSLAPHKGPQVVAAAWKQAALVDPELPALRIVGPPVDADCVASLPSDQVFPAVAPEEVPALLAEAHALVLGSIWPENAPLVIHEALAAGCPVIAPDIGGIPELVKEDVNGWLFPAGDVEALARRLLDWRALDALPVVPPMDFEAHMDGLLTHYQSLLE